MYGKFNSWAHNHEFWKKRYKYSHQRTPASLLILLKKIVHMVSLIPDMQCDWV